MKIFGNAVVFIMVYIVFMMPTYVLPYFGSNSSIAHSVNDASETVFIAFIFHLTSLAVLVLITWFRSKIIGRNALVIFPILALLFDLVPVINIIPFVPTVMHVLALVFGITWAKQIPESA